MRLIAVFTFFLFISFVSKAQKVVKLEGYVNGVHHVSYSPDGKYLLTGSGLETNKAEIRDALTGTVIRTFEGVENSIAKGGWSADGDMLYTSSGMGFKVQIWSAEGEELLSLDLEDCDYSSELVFDPSGDGFVLSCNESLLFYNEKFEQVNSIQTPDLFETFQLLSDGKIYVGSAYDYLHILEQGSSDWNTIDISLGPRTIQELTSGQIMLTDYYVMRSDEPYIRFFENDQEVKSFTFDEKVLRAYYIESKDMIIATFSGGAVRLISKEGEIINEIGSFGMFPLSLDVSPNGEQAAVGYLDSLILIDLSEI